MQLSDAEHSMLAGEAGSGVQRCMQVLVKLGQAFGASKLVKITSAHVIPNIPVTLLKELTEGIDSVPVMTTLHPHMSAFCPKDWQRMGIAPDYAKDKLVDIQKRAELFAAKGFNQTYTCYQPTIGSLPNKGDFVSWIGSGGQILINSTVGARCNRDGALITLAAAITGRAPYYGLFLDENRLARIHVTFEGIDVNQLSKVELSAIGYYLGTQAKSYNIAIEGIDRQMPIDYLKQLMIPLTVTGSVGICHVPGVTPEANHLKEAFGGLTPLKKLAINRRIINQALSHYTISNQNIVQTTSSPGTFTEMVILGCPHLTIQEVREIALFLTNRRIPKGRQLWIGLSHQQYQLAKEMGYSSTIEAAGGTLASACMSTVPDAPIPHPIQRVMTSSMKAAHYVSQLTNGRVHVGVANVQQCLKALMMPIEYKGVE
ncbi:aconitase X [Zooshikella sp. RANM57]|uniref:aconitase X n=1 Tax=Zooshikella sp. RANM57 TaxID=3425863 RepID=UPI003D7012DE